RQPFVPGWLGLSQVKSPSQPSEEHTEVFHPAQNDLSRLGHVHPVKLISCEAFRPATSIIVALEYKDAFFLGLITGVHQESNRIGRSSLMIISYMRKWWWIT
ncbi:MAG TPA: hypothetical protein VE971_00310, partial [Candidatus Eisenbacteria bacterium]|nr:hypothetical protein [Candidatus Eisenbacteria bacterium]